MSRCQGSHFASLARLSGWWGGHRSVELDFKRKICFLPVSGATPSLACSALLTLLFFLRGLIGVFSFFGGRRVKYGKMLFPLKKAISR